MVKLSGLLLVVAVLQATALAADPTSGQSDRADEGNRDRTVAVAQVGCDTVRDFSRFGRLAYRQQSAIGFCATLNSVLRATLVPDDEVLILMTVRYASRSPGCPDDRAAARCVVEGPQTCRRLSAANSARVRQALAAVRTCSGKDPACLDGVDRACLNHVLTWNTESLSDACGPRPRLAEDEGRRIQALFDALADGPTVPCGPENDDGL